MAGKTNQLKFKQTIQAPLNEVFSAFSHAAGFSEWLCRAAQADVRKGGRYYLWWENSYYASGEFVDLIPGDRIVFSWHGRGEPGETKVKVVFKPLGKQTSVSLTHFEIGPGDNWKQTHRAIKRGWTLGLENLKSVLETGEDLRYFHRPMLGFTSLQALNVDEASAMGFPPKAGLLILGTMDGMCADKAGLQTGDYIVKLSGQKVATVHELNLILNQFRAGNKVKIIYYRNGEKLQSRCELSPRPLPNIPGSLEELSKAVREVYDGLEAQLDDVLRGVRSDQMNARSSPANWSIRETLGHLIATEREIQSWVTRLFESQEADFTLHSNQPARIRAVIAAFPDLPSLRAELKRSQAETVAIVAELPPELLKRRRSYLRLALELLQNPPLHYQEHLHLMKVALEKGASADTESPEPIKEARISDVPKLN